MNTQTIANNTFTNKNNGLNTLHSDEMDEWFNAIFKALNTHVPTPPDSEVLSIRMAKKNNQIRPEVYFSMKKTNLN